MTGTEPHTRGTFQTGCDGLTTRVDRYLRANALEALRRADTLQVRVGTSLDRSMDVARC